MRIFVAQINPDSGDISSNIKLHLDSAKKAAELKANMLFFPELSLSGYEPALASNLAMKPGDDRLNAFQLCSNSTGLTLGIGLPLWTNKGIQIAMAIFRKDVPVVFYAKQYLHEDELPFFVSGVAPLILEQQSVKVMLSICYESLQPSHIEQRAGEKIDLYLASVAKSENGIKKANHQYPIMAQKHNVPVMMVNAVGPCDNFVSAGQSGIWSANGELLTQMDANAVGLIGFDTASGHVIIP
jgi:predicted amidohydrolase